MGACLLHSLQTQLLPPTNPSAASHWAASVYDLSPLLSHCSQGITTNKRIKPLMPNLQSLLQKLLLSQVLGVFHSKYGLNFVPGTLPPHCFPWVW